jgi:hypothetical protein
MRIWTVKVTAARSAEWGAKVIAFMLSEWLRTTSSWVVPRTIPFCFNEADFCIPASCGANSEKEFSLEK